MRTVWFLVVAILIAGLAPMWAAEEAKKDIPLYNGKAGAKIGDVCINPKDGAEMVWVPAGEFLMGSTDEEIAVLLKADPEKATRAFDDEKPRRKVDLDGYWMYKYEVTVAQYRKFCKATNREMPEAPDWGWKDDHPMVNVTWRDAADYVKWAGVALPTEAQWEKAARGTDGRAYPWGNEWDASKCANSVGNKLKSTQPAGSYTSGASPYGCMDMAGNASEWCSDWYDPSYYKNAPTKNPTGPSKGAIYGTLDMTASVIFAAGRMLCGGSWSYDSCAEFRCASRRYNVDAPSYCSNGDGFRCARTP